MLNEVYEGILVVSFFVERIIELLINNWHRLPFSSGLFFLFFYTSHNHSLSFPELIYIHVLHPFTFPLFSSLCLNSVDGLPVLLPPEQVQEMNLRSTSTLNAVQRLFSHHLIQTFGCDYSTSGLSLDTLQAKLRSFLELRTADGPRHDNYLIYYSGHTLPTGDWALTGQSGSGTRKFSLEYITTGYVDLVLEM